MMSSMWQRMRLGARRWLATALVGGACGAGLLPDVRASRMVPVTIEQLAAGATLVVHARVDWLESARDDAGRVFTRIGLDVMETWKGRLPGGVGRCEAVMGGGVLGERAVRASGQADYAVGDEVVAFLVSNAAGELVTVGLSQGRFLVRSEPGTGRRWVSNPFWGGDGTGGGEPKAGLAGGGTGGSPGGGVRSPLQRGLSLEELKRRTLEVTP